MENPDSTNMIMIVAGIVIFFVTILINLPQSKSLKQTQEGKAAILIDNSPKSTTLDHSQTSNSKRREAKGAAIKAWIDAWVRGGSLPHACIAVHQNGHEVFFHSTGYSDIASRTLANRDTIFRIYSMTKPVTSVAIFILIERGLLRVDDNIEEYLPEFKDTEVRKLYILYLDDIVVRSM
jgi:CubicO group peptidase (beta-lactamase class C family)